MTVRDLKQRLPLISGRDLALANAIRTALLWRHDDDEIPMSPVIEERIRAATEQKDAA